ncbi:MAG: AAA family ATPase [Acidimicrobiia bacterium]|nr:AAA family ATPase [Acidimicrobiia bacterium]
MISKIDSIKDFGIYKNFNWSNCGDIVDFKKKNIIYGWNYSGKTTLSRIFSSIRDNTIFVDYPKGDFKLTTSNNGSFSKSNLKDFPFTILVFNSDYVKGNLKWELDEEINAIYFQVGEDAKNAKRIEELENLIIEINGDESIKGKQEPFISDVAVFESFDENLFTIESKRIKNDAFSSLIEFNKGNFKRQIPLVLQDLSSFILSESDILKLSKRVKIEEPKPELELVEFNLSINDIIKEVNKLLIKEPSKTDVISTIEKDNKVLDWVEKGIALNKVNEKCLFCDNIVIEERILLLNKFYENEGSIIRNASKILFENIAIEKENLDLLNFPRSIQDINEGFQELYSKKKNSLNKKIKIYQTKLDTITNSLSEKIGKNLYKKSKEIDILDVLPLEEELKELNTVLIENNKFTTNFQKLIQTDRLKYINHLVAKYLKDNKYVSKEKKYAEALEQIKLLDEKVKKYLKEIDRLKALNNSGEEGCQQLNYFIQSFLGKDDIEIKFNEEIKKFTLLRGNEIAKNLSEGEKMAISFSHFFVTLRSIEDKKELNKSIVFIDDPISSLDGNHIFQVNAILKDFFYEEIEDTDSPNKKQWHQKCQQLFISTHNFEFFNLLKELPTRNGFRYSSKGTKGNESRYFISRKIIESQLEKLPVVYDSYKSEYHFLFKEIYDFNNDPDNSSSDKLLLMPNVLRRFLEMYTLTKYPSKDEVDQRANEIFGGIISKRICKPFHHFSHFNNIDRIGKQSEFLADISVACKELVNHIETKDKKHYKALESVL